MAPSVYLGCELVIAYGLTQLGGGIVAGIFLALGKPCHFIPKNLKILLNTLKPKNNPRF